MKTTRMKILCSLVAVVVLCAAVFWYVDYRQERAAKAAELAAELALDLAAAEREAERLGDIARAAARVAAVAFSEAEKARISVRVERELLGEVPIQRVLKVDAYERRERSTAADSAAAEREALRAAQLVSTIANELAAAQRAAAR